MDRLQQGMEVVLQTETTPGDYSCQGFARIPVVRPCHIVIAHVGNSTTHKWASQLRQELNLALLSLSDSSAGTAPPCSGNVNGPGCCHAHSVSDCQKFLVLIGDINIRFYHHTAIDTWLNGDSSYVVVPVFPTDTNPSRLLPAPLQTTNAAFWHNTIVEVVPKIFAAVGLTSSDFRIFVSYNRQDTEQLGDQLFTALAQENFDIYVDRFRTSPGINFRVHIEQELVDKAMVLVLESSGIVKSRGYQYEIAFAKKHRLGLLGVRVPGGPSLPDIVPAFRETLDSRDFLNPHNPQELTAPALARVVERI